MLCLHAPLGLRAQTVFAHKAISLSVLYFFMYFIYLSVLFEANKGNAVTGVVTMWEEVKMHHPYSYVQLL